VKACVMYLNICMRMELVRICAQKGFRLRLLALFRIAFFLVKMVSFLLQKGNVWIHVHHLW